MRSCQNSTLAILPSFSIWSELERWKSLISGYLLSWPQIKKSILLKSHFLLLYATTTNYCDMRWNVVYIPQPVMTSSVAGKRRNSKALLEAKLIPKKVTVTVRRSAAHLIHYGFRNPCETIIYEKHAQQIDEMPWKLQHLRPALVDRKGPVLLHDSARPHMEQPTHNQLEAENAFQEFVESQGMDSGAVGINTYFSLAKMCWL